MTPAPLAPPARRHPIRDPPFRRLWAGSTASLCGDQFYLVALPWVVLHVTGSAVAIGTILMAAAVPRALLMLLGGLVSDRVSPRKVLMTTASARALVVGAIGLFVALGTIRFWQLCLLAFAFGVADAFAMPAAQAFLPALVASDDLVAAKALVQSTAQLTTIVGPAPAGVAIKAVGTAWAFVFDAISFLFIPAALWTLPDPGPARPFGTRSGPTRWPGSMFSGSSRSAYPRVRSASWCTTMPSTHWPASSTASCRTSTAALSAPICRTRWR